MYNNVMKEPSTRACYPPPPLPKTHISYVSFLWLIFIFIYFTKSYIKGWLTLSCRSMKSKIMATYPDAFPEDSSSEVIDRRPDLEMSK